MLDGRERDLLVKTLKAEAKAMHAELRGLKLEIGHLTNRVKEDKERIAAGIRHQGRLKEAIVNAKAKGVADLDSARAAIVRVLEVFARIPADMDVRAVAENLANTCLTSDWETVARAAADYSIQGVCSHCGINLYENHKPGADFMPCGVFGCPHEEVKNYRKISVSDLRRVLAGSDDGDDE